MRDDLKAAIERLRALLPKITQGEWSVPSWPNRQPPILGAMLPLATTIGCTSDSRPNAEFIAIARNAMPALISELGKLEAELATIRADRDAARSAIDAQARSLVKYRHLDEDLGKREFRDTCSNCGGKVDSAGYCDPCATAAYDESAGLTLDLGELKEGERG